jgi:hypothetical protein
LSEFAHIDFLSHSAAFTVDTANRLFVFRNYCEVHERDFDLIEHLEISAGLFVVLFDHFTRRITDNGVDDRRVAYYATSPITDHTPPAAQIAAEDGVRRC